jgi:arginine deiminase
MPPTFPLSPVRVVSEIGPLRAVLVHTPGNELLAVTPGTLEEYLYDDIIDLEAARAEHRILVQVLQRFAEVYEVRDLLRDVVVDTSARQQLIDGTMDIVQSPELAARLAVAPPEEFATLLIEGDDEPRGPIAEVLNEAGSSLPALPNLFFTRDVGIVIGDDIVIGAMRYEARWSEELLIKTLFTHHPALRHRRILYDGSAERRLDHSLEGGDVHPVREDLLIVGFSNRSTAVSLDRLCEVVFSQGKITDVIVVVMPGEQTAIHLDMLFTQVDRGLCVVSPPHFIGPERLAVLHRKKGAAGICERSDFFSALVEVDFALEPILCGGTHRPTQEREQWASGCNLLTMRPGVAIAYQRNEATLAELARAGFRIESAEAFVQGDVTADDGERLILAFRGSELVRGGGGSRCMTLPLRRDDP